MRHRNFFILLSLTVGILPTRTASGQEVLRYSIVSNATKAGSEVDTYGKDGRIESSFEFNDRGRGPKLAARYELRGDGAPYRIDITGNDYLKAPVDEHFAIENGKAHWKSTSEDGTAAAGGFYLSSNGTGVEFALLANALLKAKDQPVKLLPAGEGRLERLTEATVEHHGQKLHLTAYAVTGISFVPQTVWLDDG